MRPCGRHGVREAEVGARLMQGQENPGGVSFLSILLSLPWTRCIGSVQHLKSKFGKDYLLEVKVKALTQVEPLHMEILKLFPQAARQER